MIYGDEGMGLLSSMPGPNTWQFKNSYKKKRMKGKKKKKKQMNNNR